MKILYSYTGKRTPIAVLFETPKEADAMLDLVAAAMDPTKILNRRSNAYKLAQLIDDEFLV